MSYAAMIVRLVNALGLMAIVMVLFLLLLRVADERRLIRDLALGLLFGVVACLTMLDPIEIRTGIIIDARSVPPVLAAAFAGPVGLPIAAIIPAAYRWALGGTGALAGAMSPILSGIVGLVVWRAVRRGSRFPDLRHLPALAVAGVVGPTLSLAFLPNMELALEVFSYSAPPILIVTAFGIIALGSLLVLQQQRLEFRRALIEREAVLRAVFESATDAMSVHKREPDGFRLVAVNPAALAIVGNHEKDISGRLVNEYLTASASARLSTYLSNAMSKGESIRFEDCGLETGERHYEVIVAPIQQRPEVGDLVYECRRDITWRKEVEAALQSAASTDALTGLYNRRFAERRLAEAIGSSQRHQHSLVVMLIDIDHFKRINDTFGHDGGDDVLRAFASVLKEHSRTTDLVFRWGGEEFMILLPHTEAAGALVVAERIRVSAENQLVSNASGEIRYTISGGLTQHRGTETLQHVVKRADELLYTAKGRGRNRIVGP